MANLKYSVEGKLYIDLKQPATFENESSQLKYCMRFLTEAEYQAGQNEKKHIWSFI